MAIPRKRKGPPPIKALLEMVEGSLDDDKAQDVVTIDLTGKADFADYMVIASGRSNRQVVAMAEHLLEKLKAEGMKTAAVEGLPRGDWVVIDMQDIVVHLFRPEFRDFYNLEKMWGGSLPTRRQEAALG